LTETHKDKVNADLLAFARAWGGATPGGLRRAA